MGACGTGSWEGGSLLGLPLSGWSSVRARQGTCCRSAGLGGERPNRGAEGGRGGGGSEGPAPRPPGRWAGSRAELSGSSWAGPRPLWGASSASWEGSLLGPRRRTPRRAPSQPGAATGRASLSSAPHAGAHRPPGTGRASRCGPCGQACFPSSGRGKPPEASYKGREEQAGLGGSPSAAQTQRLGPRPTPEGVTRLTLTGLPPAPSPQSWAQVPVTLPLS